MPLKFSQVCKLLSDLERVVTRDPPLLPSDRANEKRKIVEYWFRCNRNVIDSGEADGVALLSTLFPEKRSDRVYGLQETRLTKVIARCLRLNKARVKVLEGWKLSGNGDLGNCVERVLVDFDCEPKPGAAVTVEEIDATLDKLAAGCRFSGPILRSTEPTSFPDEDLGQIFQRCHSLQAKWFTRLILKDLSTVQLDLFQVTKEFHFLLPDLLRFQDSFSAAVTLLHGELKDFPATGSASIQRAARIETSKKLAPSTGVKVGRQACFKARSLQNCMDMCNEQKWSVERKYDGEFCEIHVDLSKGKDCIQIFSKSNKDSTEDRKAVHSTIKECLRIGKAGCAFKSKCIVVGELVVWSDQEQKVLDFYHIRKHVKRSGISLGRDADSQIKPGERLMLLFFDLLLVDDDMVLRKPYHERRRQLKELVRCRHGYAMTVERRIIDFSNQEKAQEILCLQFAASVASRIEGLILKPLDMPYFRLAHDGDFDKKHFVIKLKKDYLPELGGDRDVVDLAIVGASYEAKLAQKSSIRNIKFTTFHLGCATNKEAAIRFGELPTFKVVGAIDLDQCIPKRELQVLNDYAIFNSRPAQRNGTSLQDPSNFGLDLSLASERKLEVVFSQPCIVEVLGSAYEKPSNRRDHMLRHPRIVKVHIDRTWEDGCTYDELQKLAIESKDPPPDGETQEMSQLYHKYMGKFKRKEEADRRERERRASTTQTTDTTAATMSSAQSEPSATKPSGTPAPSRQRRSPLKTKISPVLIRVDTDERLPNESSFVSSDVSSERRSYHSAKQSLPTPPTSSAQEPSPAAAVQKKRSRPQESVDNGANKRPKIVSSTARVTSTPSVLTQTNANAVRKAPAPLVGSAKGTARAGASNGNRKEAGSQSIVASATLASCSKLDCPISNAIVFLSSCVRSFQWVSDTLLNWHGAEQTRELKDWCRESINVPTLGTIVAESYSHPGQQKMVFVEPNRLGPTMACVEAVKRLKVRDLVLYFDWRILEDWKELETRESQTGEALDPVEAFDKRFFGFSCWATEQKEVVFMHRDVVRMPKKWLKALAA